MPRVVADWSRRRSSDDWGYEVVALIVIEVILNKFVMKLINNNFCY